MHWLISGLFESVFYKIHQTTLKSGSRVTKNQCKDVTFTVAKNQCNDITFTPCRRNPIQKLQLGKLRHKKSNFNDMSSQCNISWNSCPESYNFLKPLVRILTRFLPRTPRICTILQDLAKNFKKNTQFFRLKKRTKRVFGTKKLLGKNQESCQEIQEIPRNSKKSKKRHESWQEIWENPRLSGKNKRWSWMKMHEKASTFIYFCKSNAVKHHLIIKLFNWN